MEKLERLDKKDFLYIFHHIFLPSKLPQREDTNQEREVGLCRAVYYASKAFAELLPDETKDEWKRVVEMLQKLLKATRALDKGALIEDVLRLQEGDSLSLYLHKQNAALIMRCKCDVITFETFEVSPPPGVVMATKGKLVRSFPGPAVQLPLFVAQDRNFVEQLASQLVQMDTDTLDTEETANKAGSKVQETRGTAHPRFITQLLMRTLQGIGEESDVKRVKKRIADDVCWESGDKPWRRSGMWLLIRVSIQLMVQEAEIFKAFMIFFQTKLLELALKRELPSELIHVARAKVGRRIYKLGDGVLSPRMMTAFHDVIKNAKAKLEQRWEAIQALQSKSFTYTHDPAAVREATKLTLDHSRAYLEDVLKPRSHTRSITHFVPSDLCRIQDVIDFAELAGDGMSAAVEADPYVALADFERLVEKQLDGWVMEKSNEEAACKILAECLDQYVAAATKHYADTPELLSTMLLMVMELWVGIDIISLNHHPELAEYSPEIPETFLNPVLLRHAKSLQRAQKVQVYLAQRHKGASDVPSIFDPEPKRNSFSVRYFRTSQEMQDLKHRIETRAQRQRTSKKAELVAINAEYHSLMDQANGLDGCDYTTWNGRRKHAGDCRRCNLVRKASALRIGLHEWPLPDQLQHPHKAEAVLFELLCPPVFETWRSTTYGILRDLGMAHVDAQDRWNPEEVLEKYDGLKTWCMEGRSGRLRLGSEYKAFERTHFGEIKVPALEENVCVNNAMKWKLFDGKRRENVLLNWEEEVNLDKYCIMRIRRTTRHKTTGKGKDREENEEEAPYTHLQYAVAKTTHTHNQTIVDQADCPSNLSLHEHLAFSNLRCGGVLQWLNIIRELRANVLTFSREEVHTLLMQAAWQLGPLELEGDEGSNEGVWRRTWHIELEEVGFGRVLVREARDLLGKVEANWMEGITVKSIIYLTTRLLASIKNQGAHAQTCQDAYNLLFEARRITHGWVREIVSKLQSAPSDEEAAELQRQACEMACTCRATYDVDAGSHLNAMFSTSDDLAVLLECAIVVHDNAQLDPNSKKPGSRKFNQKHLDHLKLLHRNRRLAHRLEERVHSVLKDVGVNGLNKAITSVWSEFRPTWRKDGEGKGWEHCREPHRQWYKMETKPLAGQEEQTVHLDVLYGTLLVNGQSLGRLPRGVVEHATYRRIFGQKILDVIPADMPGMEYASRSLVHDHQIFFSLRRNGKKLIIRARKSGGPITELIPHTVLLKDFPVFLSTEHVHWMNVDTGEVEFRPIDKLWEQSNQNWRLLFRQGDRPTKMVIGERKGYLLDIRSDVFNSLAAKISPVESAEYLMMVLDAHSRVVSVDLPRFRLAFFVNESGELESKNMQGSVIDANQSTGTMIGLRSQLVLRHKDPNFAALPRSRCVIIPYGNVQVSLTEDNNHVEVHVDTTAEQHFTRRVQWYKYEVDTQLGYLVESVGLAGRLLRIYLHAVCSHPLPDPLTHQMGTVHALQELAAAASLSFQEFTKLDFELLKLIGGLTPCRNYHPKHLKIMQKTAWSDQLPALSQHSGFYTTVRKILNHAKALRIFGDQKASVEFDLEYEADADPDLMARAAHRHGICYEVSLKAEPLPRFDQAYHARDSPHDHEHELDGVAAAEISRLVFSWPSSFFGHLDSQDDIIKIFKSFGTVNGLADKASLEYSAEWRHQALNTTFLTLYDLCHRLQDSSKKFGLMFLFSFLAYTRPEYRIFLPILLTVAAMPPSAFPAHPKWKIYNLTDGFEPVRDRVKEIIQAETYKAAASPAVNLPRKEDESEDDWLARQSRVHREHTRSRTTAIVDHLMHERQSSTPSNPFTEVDDALWFATKTIENRINGYFASCFKNSQLLQFLRRVTEVLQVNYVQLTAPPISTFQPTPELTIAKGQTSGHLPLEALLSARGTEAPAYMEQDFRAGMPAIPDLPSQSIDTTNLKDLLHRFQRKDLSLARLFGQRLSKSQRELQAQTIPTLPNQLPPLHVCTAYREQCITDLETVYSSICATLGPLTTAEQILEDCGLFPPTHPRSLLCCLASTSGISLVPEWKEALITFAKAFIKYQHAQRLVVFSLRSEVDSFYREIHEASFHKEDADEHPDWLLIQIQGNFIIRPIQSKVAAAMITSSGTNTVLQLNMGEGKSHVIVFIVATALADSHKLVRVVSLKPLARQMFHSLVERISGLANRRVFFLPFSRDVKMDQQQIRCIQSLLDECFLSRGVLMTQPEHILSFQLMVIDRTLASGTLGSGIARELYNMQQWVKKNSWDILDECDEILHVRYQLVYTMNEQHPLYGSPDRWTTTQAILDVVRRHIQDVREQYPEETELLDNLDGGSVPGAFSSCRLLGQKAAQFLISRIADDAVNGVIDTLNIPGLAAKPQLRTTLIHFIKDRYIDEQTYCIAEGAFKGSGHWNGLLLLRGLLGHGVLLHALERLRWRVDYGLDPSRSLLAVPFRAKDMPSLRSEFGHPDVAVSLTCLSYYYSGLNPSQVRDSFALLIKLDNPTQEYEKWVKRGGIGIPVMFRQLVGINTEDSQTFFKDVVPLFHKNQATIDFFLSQTVFPIAAREFSDKLSCSGWNLVDNPSGDNFVTGFSGTNDNSILLPTSISEIDPAEQGRTNAQVLSYLLRPENGRYVCAQDMYGRPLSAVEFLQQLVEEPHEIRVLLDVGAQMLEMTNEELTRRWLSLRKDVAAGVFVDDHDRLSVISQDGVVELLSSSSFAQRLDQCLVYLDDAHTRGTDLKLPQYFRAVVTLGPKVMKDRLVQGCMRMRRLGNGQSIVFYAPPEVDHRIRKSENIYDGHSITTMDVLLWVLTQTCSEIEHHIPHWIQQGVEYHDKHTAQPVFLPSGATNIEPLRQAWLQPASRTLEEMYGLSNSGSHYQKAVKKIPAMRERLQMLGVTAIPNAEMDEEQEREVSHEVEQELQLERLPKAKAAPHSLDADVKTLILKGVKPADSQSFIRLLAPLRSEPEKLDPVYPWSDRLWCSKDFARTTELGRERKVLSDYLRSVQWIVSYTPRNHEHVVLVALSPHEVASLLPSIRRSKVVRLHMYAPRTTYAMEPMDDLTFYCIPPLPTATSATPSFSVDLDIRCQLNLWSGQLYLDTYDTYRRLCYLLGLAPDEEEKHKDVESDRFVPPGGRVGIMRKVCLFNRSPVGLLKMLFGLRRKGMNFENTHLGKLLHGRMLLQEDFEDQDSDEEA